PRLAGAGPDRRPAAFDAARQHHQRILDRPRFLGLRQFGRHDFTRRQPALDLGVEIIRDTDPDRFAFEAVLHLRANVMFGLAWLMCALITISVRLAMVSTSVPLLNPPEPETACPTETGRVRMVQSNGARICVLVNWYSIRWSAFSVRSRAFRASSYWVRVSSNNSWEISFSAYNCLERS